MIRRILLENFMAHEHTVIDLAPGVTVLTGPNNTGKSAVVEALRCLATNPSRNPNPKLFIRHGAKKARVEVELADGHRIAWVRKPATSLYYIYPPEFREGDPEPDPFSKLRGEVPEEVQALLKLPLVSLEGEDGTGKAVDVHLGNQREPIFLLDQPGSTLAGFFAASTEGAHLLAMQKLLTQKVRDAKRDKDRARARRAEAEARLDTLAGLPGLQWRVEAARADKERVGTLRSEMERIAVQIDAQAVQTARLRREENRTTLLADLAAPPKLSPVTGLAAQLQDHGSVVATISRRENAADALSLLASVPLLADVATPRGLLEEWRRVEHSKAAAAEIEAALTALAPVPESAPTDDLARTASELSKGAAETDVLRRSIATIAVLSEPPAPEATAELTTRLGEISQLHVACKTAATATEKADADLAAKRAAIEARLAELPRCPTCGQPMDLTHFLEEEATEPQGGGHNG